MNISLNWLKDYIDYGSLSAQEMADKLTMAGLEVEAITTTAVIPETVVVGEILERNKHPNADKLSVCKVNIGSEILQIVCGAPNCDAGKRVPVATIGTVFNPGAGKDEFKIAPAKLRGVESFGMMCSSRELGLSDEHTGLLHLPPETPIGKKVCELFESDTVFELEVTQNRPDWLSHWGVARDLACLLKVNPKFPKITVPDVQTPPPENLVTVLDPEACPYYSARIIRNVKVTESPDWLKRRLTAIGLRPINAIVDISNYVLHELGNPLHVFDLNKLAGPRIIVRRAEENEAFTTLDKHELKLQPRHLVIADAEKAVVLAGVMGGLNSGVTEETTDVLVESAVFNSSMIRATSREMGISSDSSYRYERGVDPEMTVRAAERAVQLILEIAGGEVAYAPCVVAAKRPEPQPFSIKYSRINRLLGLDLPSTAMNEIFNRLGVKVLQSDADNCDLIAPSYRADLSREADMAEEIARINGLDRIPEVQPRAIVGGISREDKMAPLQTLRQQVVALGFNECYTYAMVNDDGIKGDPSVKESQCITLSNPLNLDMAHMRTSLFVPMLDNVERNVARNNHDLRLFELGRCFCKDPALYPEERQLLVLAMTGSRYPGALSSEAGQIDFYDLKGVLENLLRERQLAPYRIEPCSDPRFEEGHAAKLIVRGKTLAVFGQVAKVHVKSRRLRAPLFMACVEASLMMEMITPVAQYKPVNIYPAVARDVAFIAPESLQNAEVIEYVTRLKIPHLTAVRLFDIFRDTKSIGEGKKSMAYNFVFENFERTLTDDEVNKAYHAIREALHTRFNVDLR